MRRIRFIGDMPKPLALALIIFVTLMIALFLELVGMPDVDSYVQPLPEYRRLIGP